MVSDIRPWIVREMSLRALTHSVCLSTILRSISLCAPFEKNFCSTGTRADKSASETTHDQQDHLTEHREQRFAEFKRKFSLHKVSPRKRMWGRFLCRRWLCANSRLSPFFLGSLGRDLLAMLVGSAGRACRALGVGGQGCPTHSVRIES